MFFLAGLGLIAWAITTAHAQPVPVVAAENFYGEVVAAIGGGEVTVASVIDNPNLDPHDYEATPSAARAVADARVVIYNGAAYDAWMDRLVAATERPQRIVINVANLLGRQQGDNPHVWYDPAAMPAVAEAVARALTAIDPDNADTYAARARAYAASLEPLRQKIADVKRRFAGTAVTACEPVFGAMADALGLDMRNERFQMSVMNGTEPAASEPAAMEGDLRDGKVKVLFYNTQVSDPLTEQLLAVARRGGVAVVGVTETEPAGTSYADWMLGEIEATEKALSGPSA
jgi:zinc/manganese transport system substrate-binding protein